MKKKLTCSYMILFFTLYTSQFLGLGFFIEAFIGILRQNGVPLENIGPIYMLGLFWVFRFLWAPFIDKISFKNMGHYRIWVIIFQFLMVLSISSISILHISEHLNAIILLAIFFCFFSASQNIALDAFAYKIAFKKQRVIVNSLKIGGGLMGMILGGGVGLILYANIGWHFTMFIIAILTTIPLIQILLFGEPKHKDQDFIQKVDYKQYLTFWNTKKKKIWFVLLFLYPATVSAAFGMTTPILVDLGWELQKVGFTVYIVGYSIGFFASFITKFLVQKFSKKIVLVFAAFGQIVGILMLLLLFEYHTKDYLVMFVVGLIFLFYTPSQVLINTLMMDLSSSKSPASQFAIQHSIYMFSGIIFASISVIAAGFFTYEKVILVCAFVGSLALLLSTKIEYILKK